MTEQELRRYLLSRFPKEDSSCEWKAFSSLRHNISGHTGEDVISYVSAFANMHGGQLVIGLEDQTGVIQGIQGFHDYTPENLPPRLLRNCPNLSSEGLWVESHTSSDTNKTIWIIHIPKHLPRKPVFAHKTKWQRSGDNLIALTPEREAAILSEPLSVIDDWSAAICPDANIHDLDDEAVTRARETYLRKFSHLKDEATAWDNVTFLNKIKATIQGKITRTALILLGKSEAEHFISPAQAQISWILKDKDNIELDYEHFHPPLFLQVDKVYAKIRNLKYRYIKDETLFPDEVDMYEPYVIREALHNCIAHQDYLLGGRINVVEYPESLIFTNLGTFLPGSIENVIRQDAPPERYRNPFLTQAMVSLNMIDTIGSGIRRMFSIQKDRFFPLPDFDLDENRVKMTVIGKVLDLEYARVLAKHPDLSLYEIILLDKVQKKMTLSIDEIKQLRKRKLIEGRKPNLYISSRLAETIEQKEDYIKTRRFKDQHYKELILQYLKQYGSASKADIDKLLLDILPDVLENDQKQNKIRNILYAMSKRDNTIQNEGTNRKPVWKLNI